MSFPEGRWTAALLPEPLRRAEWACMLPLSYRLAREDPALAQRLRGAPDLKHFQRIAKELRDSGQLLRRLDSAAAEGAAAAPEGAGPAAEVGAAEGLDSAGGRRGAGPGMPTQAAQPAAAAAAAQEEAGDGEQRRVRVKLAVDAQGRYTPGLPLREVQLLSCRTVAEQHVAQQLAHVWARRQGGGSGSGGAPAGGSEASIAQSLRAQAAARCARLLPLWLASWGSAVGAACWALLAWLPCRLRGHYAREWVCKSFATPVARLASGTTVAWCGG